MRYFTALKNQAVVEKQAFSGDDEKINRIIAELQDRFPNLTITEVTQAEFDSTVIPKQQTQAEKDWAAFKATSPSAAQAIQYIARYLGLE